MFQGETAISIDDKGRLAIPTAFRDLVAGACNNRLVLTYNPYEPGCLWLYPESEWQKVRDQVIALPSAKKVYRSLQLKLVGAATFLEPDSSARILLPSSTPPVWRNAPCWSAWASSSSSGANRRTWRRSARASSRTTSPTPCWT